MLFRAAFWIGLVALLAPRATEFVPHAANASMITGTSLQVVDTSGSLVTLQDAFLERLLQIRADIEAQQRARAAHAVLIQSP